MLGKKQMSHILAAFCLITVGIGLFPRASAFAATEPTGFKAVQVWVNSEYDDPRLLTMVQGQIIGATPALVRFLVPTTAEMYSAGYKDAQDNYTRAPDWDGVSNIKPSDISGWNVVSFTVTTDTFRLEYYDDVVQGLPSKSISYDYRTLYPISDLTVRVQEPKRSSSFTILPKEQLVSTDSEGFQVRVYSFANVLKDAVEHFDISYTKADSVPAFSPNAGTSGPAASGSSFTTWQKIVVGLFVVMMAGGVVYALTRSNSRRKPSPASSRTRQGTGREGPVRAGGTKRFCTECGSRIQGSPKFCPDCGAKL